MSQNKKKLVSALLQECGPITRTCTLTSFVDLQERTWSNHVYVYSDVLSVVQDLQERMWSKSDVVQSCVQDLCKSAWWIFM